MDKEKAFQAFIDHTRNWLFDLPESEQLMPLLKLRFTSEEAVVFINISPLPKYHGAAFRKVGAVSRRTGKNHGHYDP